MSSGSTTNLMREIAMDSKPNKVELNQLWWNWSSSELWSVSRHNENGSWTLSGRGTLLLEDDSTLLTSAEWQFRGNPSGEVYAPETNRIWSLTVRPMHGDQLTNDWRSEASHMLGQLLDQIQREAAAPQKAEPQLSKSSCEPRARGALTPERRAEIVQYELACTPDGVTEDAWRLVVLETAEGSDGRLSRALTHARVSIERYERARQRLLRYGK